MILQYNIFREAVLLCAIQLNVVLLLVILLSVSWDKVALLNVMAPVVFFQYYWIIMVIGDYASSPRTNHTSMPSRYFLCGILLVTSLLKGQRFIIILLLESFIDSFH